MSRRRWNGLWRRGAGTPDDPDNGRLILQNRVGHAFHWSFSKGWHPKRKRLARLRCFYWVSIRKHETEICGVCGGPVRLVYHAPDWLWETATGYGPRHPSGEAAPGCLCPACLDDLADAAGLPFLRWTCTTDDSVMCG